MLVAPAAGIDCTSRRSTSSPCFQVAWQSVTHAEHRIGIFIWRAHCKTILATQPTGERFTYLILRTSVLVGYEMGCISSQVLAMLCPKFKRNLEQSCLWNISPRVTGVLVRRNYATLSWIPVAQRTKPLNGRGHRSTKVFSGSLSGDECRTRLFELLDDRWGRSFDRLELAEEEGWAGRSLTLGTWNEW